MIKQCKHESRKRTEVIHFLDGSSVCFQFHDIATFFSEFKLYNVNFTNQLFKKTNKKQNKQTTTTTKTNKQKDQRVSTSSFTFFLIHLQNIESLR